MHLREAQPEVLQGLVADLVLASLWLAPLDPMMLLQWRSGDAGDCDDTNESHTLQYMSEVTHSVMAMVYNDYLEAQKRGDIREDIKPEFIIYFLNKIYDMIKDENLVKMYEDPSQLAVELIKFFFYGISNKSANLQ